MTVDPAIDAALRAALALLFLAAAGHKVRDLGHFRATVAAYRLVPAWSAPLVVAAELGVAAALVVPSFRVAGLRGAALLLVVYAAAVAINVARGRTDLDCGCTGPALRRPISRSLVVRNAMVATAALVAAVPVAARPLAWIDALTVVGATAVLSAAWMAAERLEAQRPAIVRLRSEA